MLNFFRNFTKSRYGMIAVFVFLGLIAIAFAAGDITGLRSNGPGGGSDVLAKVGGTKITDRELRERIDRFLRNAQREGQNITMEQFLAQGGLDLALDETINSAAMIEFAKQSGMQVSKKLIDSDIANNPAFFGIDGKFSQKSFEDLLAQNRIIPAAYRDSLTQDRYATWLVNRGTLGGQLPTGVVLPYASLMLERRTGIVGFVQSVAMDPGPDPDDQALTAYYAGNRNRYMVPQRRIVRYATVTADGLRGQNAATDAEIADAYKKAGTRYAATEKRSVELVTALDQATAAKIAAQAKGGALDAAARAAGLEVRKVDAAEKAALAKDVSAAFADAAFAAQQGALAGPAQLGGTWYVYRVDKIEKIAAKSLEEARSELADEIGQRKLAQALGDLRQSIDDGVGDGKTFDEAVRDAKLTAATTPALTNTATNPDDAAYKPDPATVALLRAGFAVEQPGDEPQVVQTAADGSFALVSLEKIVPAAPRPLASIRDKVKADYLMDKALQKARTAASAAIAKLEKGVPMAQALAEAGVTKGAPPKPFDFKRSELQGKENFIQMAFSMPAKKARLVEAPERAGYYVVYVDKIEEHSAANDPIAVGQVRGALSQQTGPEYARQFIGAIRKQVKVTRNETAIARFRADLVRQGTAR
ncbi:peptidylprolyl isomerase [Sphingomonas sp. dw_22]|uniref:peptidylprolyl isomerase n=1 Tax=Sphingomonas sp. dw_22 TaxID=2721175 RepID=UPI001BD4F39F|nr:peptidylprolyl isomerase [Sphingomonas sp. dw_22]